MAGLDDQRQVSATSGSGSDGGTLHAAALSRRGFAFAVDAVILAACLAVSWLFLAELTLVYVLVGFVGYHTALAWLTGSTPGKALFGLRLERLDRRRYQTDVRRLPWLLGRSAIGYLIVDVFGLGIAVARLYAQRRPVHDIVFRTAVVAVSAETHRGLRERMSDFDRHLQESTDKVRWPRRPLSRVVKWIVTGLLALSSGMAMIRRWLSWLQRWLLRGSRSAAPQMPGGAAATTPSATTTLGILGATTVLSGAVWLQVPDKTWFGDDDTRQDVVVGGRSGPASTSGEPPADLGVASTAPAVAVSENDLRAMALPAGHSCEYADDFPEPARLVDGELQGARSGFITLDDHLLDDVDGDATNDGLAHLVCSSGAGGTSSALMLMRSADHAVSEIPYGSDAETQIADVAVYRIYEMEIDGDLLRLQVPGHRSDDSGCCPTVGIEMTYDLGAGGPWFREALVTSGQPGGELTTLQALLDAVMAGNTDAATAIADPEVVTELSGFASGGSWFSAPAECIQRGQAPVLRTCAVMIDSVVTIDIGMGLDDNGRWHAFTSEFIGGGA